MGLRYFPSLVPYLFSMPEPEHRLILFLRCIGGDKAITPATLLNELLEFPGFHNATESSCAVMVQSVVPEHFCCGQAGHYVKKPHKITLHPDEDEQGQKLDFIQSIGGCNGHGISFHRNPFCQLNDLVGCNHCRHVKRSQTLQLFRRFALCFRDLPALEAGCSTALEAERHFSAVFTDIDGYEKVCSGKRQCVVVVRTTFVS